MGCAMKTTITGMFPDHQLARLAVANLRSVGFRRRQVRIVDAAARDRHEFIAERTGVARRVWRFGLIFGPAAGLLAGVLLSGMFAPLSAIVVGVTIGSLGGLALSLVVGRTTATQMREEIEHQVEVGTVLVSVRTDGAHSSQARSVMADGGAVNMVSSVAAFRAGVLPVAPPGDVQEQRPPKVG
jgi:hypothetical protein